MDDAEHTPSPATPELRSPAPALALALAGTAFMLVACAGSSSDRKVGRVLSPSDFADPNAPPIAYRDPDGLGETGGEQTSSPRAIPMAARPLTLVTSPGSPTPAPDEARPAAGPAFVDAKVGDINGRPIYANEFLEPLADRLRAESERLSSASWRRFAQAQIRRELDGLVRDELLRAEAVSSLTPEQRQGLRSFLRSFREDVVSRNLGSQTLAAKRIEEETGQSLDEALQAQEELTLVRLEFQRVINKRVNVSWRDVELRYEQRADEFNPPPTARFRLIRVRTSDKEAIKAVTDALARGVPFAEVASGEHNGFNPEEGGLHEAKFTGEFEDAEFWAVEALNEPARTLSIGQVVGPFEFGSFTGWMTLESITQEKVDLYDAQRQIYEELLTERRNEELTRYIERLMERANVTGLDEIERRLLAIAERRYGP